VNANVRIDHLTKYYDRDVVGVDDVSLEMGMGIHGLLGPNGAGKTTLMRILATLLDPTSGSATIEGYDVERNRADIRRILGYLPQQFGLYPQMTCREFLDYVGLLYGMSGRERRERIARVLGEVHLEEVADRRIRTLSGGMKQRLGIAQAVLAGPKLLIVDEPTAGLDPEERIRIRNLLGELAGERVVILSTHIVGDLSVNATSIALLKAGKAIYHGTPSALLAEVRGLVWVAQVEEDRLPDLKTACAVTSVNRAGDAMEARIITEEPMRIPGVLSAEPAHPGLEEAYIWTMADRDIVGVTA
jgi:ABC-2 type transport system ATP-binding protein